jgi:uncharacterized membrane protein
MTNWSRLWKHLNTGTRAVRRALPQPALDAITAAVRDCESRHPGEIRFAVEHALPFGELWRGVTPRQRAQEVFAQLRVWDTEHNNGVLIYVLLADRGVEIVADRGVGDAHVAPAEWQACCRVMEEQFRAGRFREGAVAGIEAVADVLRRHPPARADAGNELPDEPTLL